MKKLILGLFIFGIFSNAVVINKYGDEKVARGLLVVGVTTMNNKLSVNGTGSASALQVNGAQSTTGTANFATSDGNVGIGTTTPYEKLDVAGNIQLSAENASIIVRRAEAYGNRTILGASSHDKTFIRAIDNNATDGVEIQNFTSSSLAYFRTDGNVGIGTTAPSTKLEVAGTVSASIVQSGQFISDVAFGQTIVGSGTRVTTNYVITDSNPGSGTTRLLTVQAVSTFAPNNYPHAGLWIIGRNGNVTRIAQIVALDATTVTIDPVNYKIVIYNGGGGLNYFGYVLTLK